MSERLTAEQVAAECESIMDFNAKKLDGGILTDFERGSCLGAADAASIALSRIQCNLIHKWQDEPNCDGWYWCEDLGPDSPPQKIEPFCFGDTVTWKRWTSAGWVDVTGRVAPCTGRPSNER